jgi:phosphohistidine phosphatase SixA
MRLILVRHSRPVEKDMWNSDSIDRPLSKTGIFRAEQFARLLLKRYGHNMDYMISSQYYKSIQTADILADRIKPRNRLVTHLLNPGTPLASSIEYLSKFMEKAKTVMIIGHFPELSDIAAAFTDIQEQLYFKKPSCLELDMNKEKKGKITFSFAHDDDQFSVRSPFKSREADSEPVEEYDLSRHV